MVLSVTTKLNCIANLIPINYWRILMMRCDCSELWNCVEEINPQDPEGVLLLYQAGP